MFPKYLPSYLINILLWKHVISSRISTYMMVLFLESNTLELIGSLTLLIYRLCCAEKKKVNVLWCIINKFCITHMETKRAFSDQL